MTDPQRSRPSLVNAILELLDQLMYEYATADDLIVQLMGRLRDVRLAFDAGGFRSKPQRTAAVPEPETIDKQREPSERRLADDDEFATAFSAVFREQIDSLLPLDFEADSVAANSVVAEVIASPDFAELFTEFVRRHLPLWRHSAF